jgi:hypothetical protein
VRGTVYFGYNVVKREGSPPATLDFALDYGPPAATATPTGAGR